MGLNRKLLASGTNAKVSFQIEGDDGTYKCRVAGIPNDYTPSALADHLKGKEVPTSTKQDGRTYSATVKGKDIAPFVQDSDSDVGEALKKRGKSTPAAAPAPSLNGDGK
jgi:hypothetical protein